MPKHPPVPHLYEVKVDGGVVVAIRAMSSAEARDAFIASSVAITRATPARAFALGAMGIDMAYAKPEYAEADLNAQGELIGEDEVDGVAALGPERTYDTRAAAPAFPTAEADTNEA